MHRLYWCKRCGVFFGWNSSSMDMSVKLRHFIDLPATIEGVCWRCQKEDVNVEIEPKQKETDV